MYKLEKIRSISLQIKIQLFLKFSETKTTRILKQLQSLII